MTRMICIGAQSVATPQLTTAPRNVEMLCRRDSGRNSAGDDRQRYSFSTTPLHDAPGMASPQLALFEESLESVGV